MTLNIVPSPSRNLADIPAMLRHTADRIEKGELGDVQMVFVIVPKLDDWPDIMGFGADANSLECMHTLARAHMALVKP